MAIISIPILGRASGKLSDVELYTLKHQNIIRSKKLKRYKPRHATNIYYQQYLKRMVKAAVPLSGFLKLSYNRPRKLNNYFNQFISDNYNFLVFEEDFLFTIPEPEKLLFSKQTSFFNYNPVVLFMRISEVNIDLTLPTDRTYLDIDVYVIYCCNFFSFLSCWLLDGSGFLYPAWYQHCDYPGTSPREFDGYAVIFDRVANTWSKTYYLGRYEL